ncbi:MAG: arylsulfatase [Novosphingobium sp.]|uniref:arylsulfatase n=1 Tax=Novosphingobium sp. TaxID=1874826 RepID=UPI003B9C9A58
MTSITRRTFAAGLLAASTLSGVTGVAARSSGSRRPNLITIVLDDMGFSDLGCYGGEIATPNIDKLAARGLRFTRFDSKAVCSATRAALLTGRNGHTVNFPDVPDTAWGDNGRHFGPNAYHLPTNIRTTAQVLGDDGYATWAVGKWHLIPLDQLAPGTPRANWPRARGFDYFYGFARGWTDQYRPALVENDDYIDPPLPPGYHLTADLIDKSIHLIANRTATKPFFLQLALGVAHSPIQVPSEWADRYRGKYDAGWDAIRLARFKRMREMGLIPADTVLPPRESDDRAWDDLSDDERAVFARYMEVYAGFIEHADAQIGRLLTALEQQGLSENTMVVLLSDNGAASEAGQAGFFAELYRPNTIPVREQRQRLGEMGTAATQAEYPRPWAIASCAPFRRYKLFPYLGGVRTPMIVSWPSVVKHGGGIRRELVDVVDVGPTLLAAAGLEFPATAGGVAQMPVAGRSFLPMLRDAGAKGRTRQYFELRGHRAITDGRWRAVAIHNCANEYAQDAWQLFDTEADFSESADLSAKHPEIVERMKVLWQREWLRHVGVPLSQPAPNICRLNEEYNQPTMRIPDR